MSTRHEVRATGYEFNMSSWCIEKSHGVVEGVARSLELLKTVEGTEQAQRQLHLVLNYATKLFAFGAGGEWKFEDPKLVIERGVDGVEQLAKSYGVGPETTKERNQRELDEALTAIEMLLAGPASPNRTQLHEVLRAPARPAARAQAPHSRRRAARAGDTGRAHLVRIRRRGDA